MRMNGLKKIETGYPNWRVLLALAIIDEWNG